MPPALRCSSTHCRAPFTNVGANLNSFSFIFHSYSCVNPAGILGDAEADPEGLAGGEERVQWEKGLEKWLSSSPTPDPKNDFFSL